MDIATALRLGSGVAWLPVALLFSGSVARGVAPGLFGKKRFYDERWAFSFFIAMHQMGFTGRFITHQTGPAPTEGAPLLSLLTLHVLSIVLACAVFWRRYKLEGLRW